MTLSKTRNDIVKQFLLNTYKKTFFVQGGQGDVYKLECGQQIFVVKEIILNNLKQKAQELVLNEAKMANSELEHQNMIKYLYYEHEQSKYVSKLKIYTEYADLGTLQDFIYRNRLESSKFSEDFIWYVLISLMDVLNYIHEKELVHRDIKPSNLFFKIENGKQCLKLGDFGMSKRGLTNLKTVAGTLEFQAPEVYQENKDGYSYESDYWSVGVILYTMLTLQPPVVRKSNFYDIEQLRKEIFEYDFSKLETVYVELKQQMLKLLKLDCSVRMTSKEFFSQELIKQKVNLLQKNYEFDEQIQKNFNKETFQTFKKLKIVRKPEINELSRLLAEEKIKEARDSIKEYFGDKFEQLEQKMKKYIQDDEWDEKLLELEELFEIVFEIEEKLMQL